MNFSRRSTIVIGTRAPAGQRRAFTLVELLVSMTILALIVGLLAQLTKSATDTSTTSTRQAESDNAARTVFNMMEGDLRGMLRRSDVDYFFYKNGTVAKPGNDSMWFYSYASAYYIGGSGGPETESPLAFVGYRIPTVNNRPNSRGQTDTQHPNYVLERVGRPIQWMSGDQQYFLTRPAPTTAVPSPTPYSDSTFLGRYFGPMGSVPYTDGDWAASAPSPSHIVSLDTFRMEFCFLMNDGSYLLPATAADMRKAGTSVRALVVAIALLDPKSRAIVPDMSKVAGALPDIQATDLTATPPRLMAETWNTVINSGNFNKTAGIPVTASSQVRVYQRIFDLATK